MRGWRNAVVLALTTALILGGVWAVQTWVRGDAGDPGSVTSVSVPSDVSPPATGERAADFTATTLDGQDLALSGLRGQPVWLVFGATWCANCRAEAPDVAKVARDYAGRVHVVSVYVGESTQTVKGYADRVGLTYAQVADPDQRIAAAYRIMGIPAHFFIDAEGVIRSIRVGVVSPADAAAELDALLG